MILGDPATLLPVCEPVTCQTPTLVEPTVAQGWTRYGTFFVCALLPILFGDNSRYDNLYLGATSLQGSMITAKCPDSIFFDDPGTVGEITATCMADG